MSKPSERLKQMGLTLPPVAKPLAAYVPCVRHDRLLFLSGQVTMRDGRLAYQGHYHNRQKQGHWVVYYPSGTKKYETVYEKGYRIGPTVCWSGQEKRVLCDPELLPPEAESRPAK